MIEKHTLDFLSRLKKNNNRDWFEKNKEKYLVAKDNVSEMIDALLKDICTFDKRYTGLTSKDCLFRIYRDVRFSKDKKPYKSNMGASITIGGKKSPKAGYYIHFEPGQSFLAGGVWQPEADVLKKIRQEIDYNGKQFHKIIGNKDFKKYFGELDKSYQLKTTPKGYDKDHPDIELLRLNSFIVWHQFNDKNVLSKNFVKEIGKGAKIMKPFLDFLNQAMD
jgi:uncharacterized protein (TIGR02453 family)